MLSTGLQIDGRYQIRSFFGETPIRQVYRAFDSRVEVDVALWTCPLAKTRVQQEDVLGLSSEVRKLKHPSLLRLFSLGLDPSVGVFVTAQLGTEDPWDPLVARTGEIAVERVREFAIEIGAGLQTLHEKGMFHGWLCPRDIVSVAGQRKIGAFGFGRALAKSGTEELWEQFGLQRRYLAPETRLGQAGKPADWYSLAALILGMECGASSGSLDTQMAALEARNPQRADALRAALAPSPEARPLNLEEFLAPVLSAWNNRPEIGEFRARTPNVGLDSFLSDDEATVVRLAISEDAQSSTYLPSGDSEFDGEATVVEDSPEHRLELISMKEKAEAGNSETQNSAEEPAEIIPSPRRPVLRPLSSVAPMPPERDLGSLAPPRFSTSGRRGASTRARWAILLAGLSFLLLLAAIAALTYYRAWP